LQVAAANGYREVVGLLLERDVDISIQCKRRNTALHAVAVSGQCEVVELLLERGAHLNTKSRGFGPALQAAATNGHDTAVRLLLEGSADMNAQQEIWDLDTILRPGNALQAVALGGQRGHSAPAVGQRDIYQQTRKSVR